MSKKRARKIDHTDEGEEAPLPIQPSKRSPKKQISPVEEDESEDAFDDPAPNHFDSEQEDLSFDDSMLIPYPASQYSSKGNPASAWDIAGMVAVWIGVFAGTYFLYKAVGEFQYKEIIFAVGSLGTAFFGAKAAGTHVGKFLKFLVICLAVVGVIALVAYLFKHFM